MWSFALIARNLFMNFYKFYSRILLLRNLHHNQTAERVSLHILYVSTLACTMKNPWVCEKLFPLRRCACDSQCWFMVVNIFIAEVDSSFGTRNLKPLSLLVTLFLRPQNGTLKVSRVLFIQSFSFVFLNGKITRERMVSSWWQSETRQSISLRIKLTVNLNLMSFIKQPQVIRPATTFSRKHNGEIENEGVWVCHKNPIEL